MDLGLYNAAERDHQLERHSAKAYLNYRGLPPPIGSALVVKFAFNSVGQSLTRLETIIASQEDLIMSVPKRTHEEMEQIALPDLHE